MEGNALVLELDLRGLAAPILVDPDWTTTGTMTVGHWMNSAWLLDSGDAVVAGGCALAGCPSSFARPVCGTVLADTEIWDHGSGTWRAGPPLATPRYDFANTDAAFTDLLGDTYWSSTPTYGIPSLAQSLSFNLGVQDGVSVDSPAYAVCVRHLPVVTPPDHTSSGCGCHVASARDTGLPLGLLGTVVLGLALAWRRRR